MTERGRRWLGLAAGVRLKLVLDALRAAAEDEFPFPDYDYDDDEYDEHDVVEEDEPVGDGPLILAERLDYLPYDPGRDTQWYQPIECRAAMTAAFRSTADAGR